MGLNCDSSLIAGQGRNYAPNRVHHLRAKYSVLFPKAEILALSWRFHFQKQRARQVVT